MEQRRSSRGTQMQEGRWVPPRAAVANPPPQNTGPVMGQVHATQYPGFLLHFL